MNNVNSVIVKTPSKNIHFQAYETNLNNLVFPDGTVLVLADKINIRNINGILFWDVLFRFATLDTTLSNVITTTKAATNTWVYLLAFYSEDGEVRKEALEVAESMCVPG